MFSIISVYVENSKYFALFFSDFKRQLSKLNLKKEAKFITYEVSHEDSHGVFNQRCNTICF